MNVSIFVSEEKIGGCDLRKINDAVTNSSYWWHQGTSWPLLPSLDKLKQNIIITTRNTPNSYLGK